MLAYELFFYAGVQCFLWLPRRHWRVHCFAKDVHYWMTLLEGLRVYLISFWMVLGEVADLQEIDVSDGDT